MANWRIAGPEARARAARERPGLTPLAASSLGMAVGTSLLALAIALLSRRIAVN